QFIATGGNPRASYISGVNVDRITISAFVLAGILAAVAGLLAAGRQGSVTNTMGEGMVLLAFAGALLGGASLQGGAGTPRRMLGGAVLLALFSNALSLLAVGVHLVYASKGAFICVALLIDQARIRWRNRLLHREQLERLSAAGVQETGAVEAVGSGSPGGHARTRRHRRARRGRQEGRRRGEERDARGGPGTVLQVGGAARACERHP